MAVLSVGTKKSVYLLVKLLSGCHVNVTNDNEAAKWQANKKPLVTIDKKGQYGGKRDRLVM